MAGKKCTGSHSIQFFAQGKRKKKGNNQRTSRSGTYKGATGKELSSGEVGRRGNNILEEGCGKEGVKREPKRKGPCKGGVHERLIMIEGKGIWKTRQKSLKW